AYLAVPLVWLALRGGLAPPGSYVLDPGFDLARLQRIPYLVKTVLAAATLPVIALALWGSPYLVRRARRAPALQGMALFFGLFLAALVAFGHSYPIGSPLIVDREAHLLLVAISLAAGIGWTRLRIWAAARPGRRPIEMVAATVILLGLGLQTARYHEQRSAAPRQRRALAAAKALDRLLPAGRRALVLAPAPPPKPLALYLDKMRAAGPRDLRAAQAMVERYGRPSDLQLLALHLDRGIERLVSFDQAPLRADPIGWLRARRVSMVAIFPLLSDWPQPPAVSLPRAWLDRLRPRLSLVDSVQIEGESVDFFRLAEPGAAANSKRHPPARRFAEVAVRAGVAFAARSEGAAWGDLDRDGDFDLLVTADGERPRLYRNDSSAGGPLRFAEVGARWGLTWSGRTFGAAWADWDGDGDHDLAISAWPRPLLYRNDGSAFTEVGADYGIEANLRAQGLSWFDLEGDFRPELLIAGLDGTRLYRFAGRGVEEVSAHWGLDPAQGGVGAAFALGPDGGIRLAIAGAVRSRYLRLRGGRFEPLAIAGAPRLPAWLPARDALAVGACWDGARGAEGFDLFETRFRRGNRLFRSTAGGALSEISGSSGLGASRTSIGCAWGDIDLDGDQDVFIANEEVDALYLNQSERRAGAPSFRERALWLGVADPDENVGAAFADADNDGDLDLFVANYSGPDRLFENRGRERALRVRAFTPSGAAAIGALVTVRSPGATPQMQQVDGGSGFASQAAPELLFAVPPSAEAEVLVAFPNQETVILHAVATTTLSVKAAGSLRPTKPTAQIP
ncbi:MAG TPA: VCBS repeat-containing protein, partial [Acidobacteriota bacterium]